MDKAKLIEKLKIAKERLNKYIKPEDHLWAVGLNPDELDLILTSLTAPVPDGKVTDEEIMKEGEMYGRVLVPGHIPWYQDKTGNMKVAFIDGAKWMRNKLTKTPDAG